jgi:hypothetical protein
MSRTELMRDLLQRIKEMKIGDQRAVTVLG